MEKKIVAIVGMCGSGKSELTELFKADGYLNIHFGDVTMNELKRRGMEVNEANERFVREDVRRQYGAGAFAVLLLPEIREKERQAPLVLDGLYSWSEYKILKDELGDRLHVMAVVTSSSVRKARLAKRPVRPLTAAEVDSRDYSEIENLEKGGPIAIADSYILNDGSMDELKAQYEKLKAMI